jgi:hypothetical protein
MCSEGVWVIRASTVCASLSVHRSHGPIDCLTCCQGKGSYVNRYVPTFQPRQARTLPSKHFPELFPNSPSIRCNTSIYGLDHAKQNRSMIRTKRCYDGRHSMQLPSQCQTNDYTPGIDTYVLCDNSPKNKWYPIELFPREYTKDRIHVDRRLAAVVLTSHDERTHRDVGGIISFNILRSQIKVRVPVPNAVCQKRVTPRKSVK